ncbi:MFS monocarboxylate transporter [Fusarium napiforme]|uniref:MFS monocarboxylate transporter n=1 Tax=Fusarium napiforme TaxID=42672 RepID=A0A8H5JSG6_9HYPO|nr:MFS monocarboxylate transporter [Fusarium napiforme]
MIRPGNCSQAPHGTSFYNDGYANFTIQFYRPFKPVHVRDESRRASVLTIAAYRSQMHNDEFLFDQVASAELPKSLIDVRTIDDSLSHEADYVFIDLTRTDKHGFLKNAQRINVSASRAQSVHFSSVRAAKFPSSTPSVISGNREVDRDDDSVGTEKGLQISRQFNTDKRAQASTSRLKVSRTKGCRKAGTLANQNFKDNMSSFNGVDSDEEFLTYRTVLAKANHAHKAVILRELEKLCVIEWAEEANKTPLVSRATTEEHRSRSFLTISMKGASPDSTNWIVHLRAEVQMKLGTFGSTRFNTLLNTTLDDDRCFSGVFMGLSLDNSVDSTRQL